MRNFLLALAGWGLINFIWITISIGVINSFFLPADHWVGAHFQRICVITVFCVTLVICATSWGRQMGKKLSSLWSYTNF